MICVRNRIVSTTVVGWLAVAGAAAAIGDTSAIEPAANAVPVAPLLQTSAHASSAALASRPKAVERRAEIGESSPVPAKLAAFGAALDSYARDVQTRMGRPGADSDAHLRQSELELRNAARTLVAHVAEGDRRKILNDVDEYELAATGMARSADDRRAQFDDYSNRCRALVARTAKAIDSAAMVFGRVFARE